LASLENSTTLQGADSRTVKQLARDKDAIEDVEEQDQDLPQSILSFVADERVDGCRWELGKGVVGWRNQGRPSRAGKSIAELSNLDKEKESAQVAGSDNAIGDTVENPTGHQDTIDNVDDTVRDIVISAKDLFTVNFKAVSKDPPFESASSAKSAAHDSSIKTG
jgi:hypothetical protein